MAAGGSVIARSARRRSWSPAGVEHESLHPAIVRRTPTFHEAARLEPVDDARDIRRVALERVGQIAHRDRLRALEHPQHVRLHERQVELLERADQPAAVPHREPERDRPRLAGRIVSH